MSATLLDTHAYELSLTAACFIGWWLLLGAVRLVAPSFEKGRKTRLTFEATVISFVHCLFAVPVGLKVWMLDEPIHPLWGKSDLATIQFAISTGYFLWDLSICVIEFHEFGVGMFAHAVITSTSFGMALTPFIHHPLCFFLLYEVSTLFLDITYLMEIFGLTSGLIYLANGFLFASSFFYFRIFLGTRVTLQFWSTFWNELLLDPTTTLAWRLLVWMYISTSAGLMVLNYYWFAIILKELKKAVLPAAETKKAQGEETAQPRSPSRRTRKAAKEQ